MDPISEIVHYIRRIRYEDLAEEAVEAARKTLVDTLGAGIAGSSAPMGRMAAEMVRDCGGKKQSTILVYGDKVPVQEAAFANAIMSRCRELDDCHMGSKRPCGGHGGHANVVVVPASLAMLEVAPAPVSGRKLILAIAVGGDLIIRLRLAAGEAGEIGWMGETLAPFGVVASAAKLFDLSEEVVTNAIGAAYTFCSGTGAGITDGAWSLWLSAGLGARSGVVAVDLARRGYQGPRSPFLGRFGLYPLYFRGEYLESVLLSDLGTEFESANVRIKPYSSCMCTHSAIYTTLEIIKRHKIRAEQIERINVKTNSFYLWTVVLDENGRPKHTPRNVCDAQFSMPFTIATAIMKGAVLPDILTSETLDDREILGLSQRVVVEVSPEKDEFRKTRGHPPDDVAIYTKDGQSYSGA